MTCRSHVNSRAVAGLIALGALSGCGSILPETTPFTPVVETFDGKYIDTIDEDVEAARGPEADGFSTKALNDLQVSQGLATMNISGLVDAPEMLAYLRNVLARVVGVYPYDKPAIELYIDASDRGTAQATPDAEIYVGLGFLEKVETEGQLAMVLAHEAAHVLLNHFSRQDYIDAQRKAVTAGAGIAMIGAAATNVDLDRDRGQVMDAEGMQDTAESALALQSSSWLINRVSDHVINNLWSRKQEEAADLLAADLLIKSGYNPRASADLFRLLVELRAAEGSYLDYLKKQQEITFRELGESDSAIESAGQTVKALFTTIGGAGKEAWRRMGVTHIDPAARQKSMITYRKREYGGVKFTKAERDAERSKYEHAKGKRLPATLLEGHRAANKATTALIERRIKDAEGLAKKGISGPTENSAHTRTVMANVRHAQRRYDDALKNLKRIAPNELRSRQSFELEMTLHLLKGRPEEALAVTDEAKAHFGTDEPFWPMRIQIQLRRNEVDLAWAELDRCKAEAVSANIRGECAAVMKNRQRPGAKGSGGLPGGNLFEGFSEGLGNLLPGS